MNQATEGKLSKPYEGILCNGVSTITSMPPKSAEIQAYESIAAMQKKIDDLNEYIVRQQDRANDEMSKTIKNYEADLLAERQNIVQLRHNLSLERTYVESLHMRYGSKLAQAAEEVQAIIDELQVVKQSLKG